MLGMVNHYLEDRICNIQGRLRLLHIYESVLNEKKDNGFVSARLISNSRPEEMFIRILLTEGLQQSSANLVY